MTDSQGRPIRRGFPSCAWLSLASVTSGICLLLCAAAWCADGLKESAATTLNSTTNTTPSKRSRRPVTVADAIRMTRFADTRYLGGGTSKGIVANFSPDGKKFLVVLSKGNLEQNTNEYSLLLFQTAEVFHSPTPRTLVALSSSSNRPAISNAVWLEDNDTVLFLGEHPGERTQLYSVTCRSGAVKQLTQHATNIVSFASNASGDRIVYAAESPAHDLMTTEVLRNGVSVSRELLSDLIKGTAGGGEADDHELFIRSAGGDRELQAHCAGRIEFSDFTLLLSPDGNYFVVQTQARQIPKIWGEYDDRFLKIKASQPTQQGTYTNVFQYELGDMRTGESQPLIDAPIPTFGSEISWAPDSRSLAVSDAYLPLNVTDPAERVARKAHTFLVEIKVPSRELVKISDRDLRLIQWDAKTNAVMCELGRLDSLNGKPVPKLQFRKNGDRWSEAGAPKEASANLPEIVLDENLNTPPRIFAVAPTNGQKSLLMDLNPEFGDLVFGRVEEVSWKNGLGDELQGGLYWPANYVAGTKYPLVIQTHGFTPEKFEIDGAFTTAFAAQALAGKGFFVLQASDLDWHHEQSLEEAPGAMATYESAIDYLDHKGLIEREHVGLIGFSRTFLYVTYTLTHSTYKFGAAVVADGIDGGYFQYMVMSNFSPMFAQDAETLNGAPPFGEGLDVWMKRSPEFRMDKIRTPLRIQATAPTSLLSEWSWFSGLSRLGRPVEMIYIPDGAHALEKPWERMVSQQGDVDWFCFWLKGEEDPDPAKAEQYRRWRQLRVNQQ
jgi:dipeptidyl aminopeptidase/acylaminoacyl peptidase